MNGVIHHSLMKYHRPRLFLIGRISLYRRAAIKKKKKLKFYGDYENGLAFQRTSFFVLNSGLLLYLPRFITSLLYIKFITPTYFKTREGLLQPTSSWCFFPSRCLDALRHWTSTKIQADWARGLSKLKYPTTYIS